MLRKIFVLMFVLLSVTLVGCSSKPEKEVKIGVIVGNSTSPQPFVMMDQDQKMLKEKFGEDVKFSLHYNRDVNFAIEAMEKSEYDIFYLYWGAFAEYSSKLSKFGEGDNYIAVAGAITSGARTNALMTQPGITDVKQLAGKTIGVFNTDPSAEVVVANTLKKYGLDATTRGGNVTIKKMPSQQVLNAFVKGEIDSLLVRRDYIEDLQKQKKNLLLWGNDMAYGGKNPSMWVFVKKDFLEQNADFIEKFLEVHIDAGEYFKKNRKEVADLYYPIKEQFFKDRKIEYISRPIGQLYQTFDKLVIEPYPHLQYINDAFEYAEKFNVKKPYPKDTLINFTILDKVLSKKGMPSIADYNASKLK